MTQDDDFLVSLQKDFLDEAGYLMEMCEESYLKLEVPSSREEELGKIFRMAHSFKGAGAAVGFSDLAEFAHKVEDCLALLRAFPESVDSETISLLLLAGDEFKKRVEQLKNNSPHAWDPVEIRKKIIQKTLHLEQMKENFEHHIHSQPHSALHPELKEEVKEPDPVESLKPTGTPELLKQESAKQSIKVDVERIDSVLNLVGELVVIKSQLSNQLSTASLVSENSNSKLENLVLLLDKTVRELQDCTLNLRLTPLKTTFIKTQRVIRDLTSKLNKKVDFQMRGEDTEIDRTMVELLSDPLLHMARNSLDHGIESPEVRVQKGKNPTGTLLLQAEQANGKIVIKISDDGAGLDKNKILTRAIDRGLVPSDRNPDSLSDSEIFNFIYEPGFSTAEKVSDVSGRGVGMDVVKTNISKLKGIIEIESTPNVGTTMKIILPLTTSITDGIIIRCQNERYVLPMDSITEFLYLESGQISSFSNDHQILKYRDRLYSVLNLDKELKKINRSRNLKPDMDSELNPKNMNSSVYMTHESKDNLGILIHVDDLNGERDYCLTVSEVIGQTQVVLKPIEDNLSQNRGISGAVILGDGQVALVIEPRSIINQAQPLSLEAR